MPELAQIVVYPIKALDGVTIAQTTALASGALKHDREFAIVDLQGNVVNGKRTAAVHQIRSSIDLSGRTVTLSVQGEEARHNLPFGCGTAGTKRMVQRLRWLPSPVDAKYARRISR